jgi:hypothetical protein
VRIRQLYGAFVLNSWCGGLLLLLAVGARAELTDETQTTPNVPAEGDTVAEVATGHPFVPPTGLALSSDGKRISVASTDEVRATVTSLCSSASRGLSLAWLGVRAQGAVAFQLTSSLLIGPLPEFANLLNCPWGPARSG